MGDPFPYDLLAQDALELINDAGRLIKIEHPTLDAVTTMGVFLDSESNSATPSASSRRDSGSQQEQSAFYIVPDVGVEFSNEWFVIDRGRRRTINRVQIIDPGPRIVVSFLFVGA